jgi:hypothetical protein
MSLSLVSAIQSVVFAFLASLFATIAIRLLTGTINTQGVLRTKSPDGDDSLSPARVQLLVFTLAAAGTYLGWAIEARGSGEMPKVPESWLVTLGGSHVFYLGSKAFAFLGKRWGFST